MFFGNFFVVFLWSSWCAFCVVLVNFGGVLAVFWVFLSCLLLNFSLRVFVFFGIFLAFFLPVLCAFLVSVVVVLFFAFFCFSRPKSRKIFPSTPETNVSDSETLVLDVKTAFSIVIGVVKKFHFLVSFLCLFWGCFWYFCGIYFGFFLGCESEKGSRHQKGAFCPAKRSFLVLIKAILQPFSQGRYQ